ncbi:DsbA family oxidoreductase [Streptomonospora salina]|uniref:Putative DsbA family dithiol-disulfide isomerase n=1 Tax=Streptomonospora salina TaxID=104205 RepID=A0A841EF26_9ACTN|nr:DsbA family protein [Streptomonospora salina]MBB6000934.1 putative DsbA family dithiol-disulfide isomerase [Streptomonospora salina]
MDVACVLSYLVFTRFRRAAQRLRADGTEVELVFLPYRFRPDADPRGEPLVETHRRDRGEAAVREIQATTGFGAADGLHVDFTRVVSTDTFHAHRLIAQAAAQGRGEAMAERLFRAYFSDGVNVAEHPTLRRLAEEAGVGMHAGGAVGLRAELERVRAAAVAGGAVPAFRFADGRVLAGEQPQEAFAAALAQ